MLDNKYSCLHYSLYFTSQKKTVVNLYTILHNVNTQMNFLHFLSSPQFRNIVNIILSYSYQLIPTTIAFHLTKLFLNAPYKPKKIKG